MTLVPALAGLILAAPASHNAAVAVVPVALGAESGLGAEDVEKFTEFLDASVGARGFKMVARSEVRLEADRLRQESYKDCYDESCQIEVGKAVAAQKVVIARWYRIASSCTLSLKLLDLRTLLATTVLEEDYPCTEAGLQKAIRAGVRVLPAPNVRVQRKKSGLAYHPPVNNLDPRQQGFINVKVRTARVEGDVGEDAGRTVKARVYLNRGDKIVGSTHGQLGWTSKALAVGTHRVTVLYRESEWAPQQKDVQVFDGETTEVEVTLQPRFGLIDFSSEPSGATVEVDGKPLAGTTPLSAVRIRSGAHSVLVQAPDYLPKSEEIEVDVGQRREILSTLQPDFGSLAITSDPSEAKIEIKAQDTRQRTPVRFDRLPPGPTQIRVSRPGYAPRRWNVEIQRGQETKLHAALQPKYGSLKVRAPVILNANDDDNPDCRAQVKVFQGGNLVTEKTTPAIFRQLIATQHQILVTCNGKSRRKTVTIVHNKEVELAVKTDMTTAVPPPQTVQASAPSSRSKVGVARSRGVSGVEIAAWTSLGLGAGQRSPVYILLASSGQQAFRRPYRNQRGRLSGGR